MNRDEVMEMPDDELRVKAAELMGWKECGPSGSYVNSPTGIPPAKWLEGKDEMYLCRIAVYGDVCSIPNYPNDIAAAWELVDHLADIGDKSILVRFDSLRGNNPSWTVYVEPDVRMDVNRYDVPRAITRAFIVAMKNS